MYIKTLTKLKNQYLNDAIGSMKNSLFGSMMPTKIAESVGSQVIKTREVGRQRHRANVESETEEEYFRRNLAIPFCDFF